MPATPVNVSVIYYSSTGTTHQMAQRLGQAAEKAGAEVRLRHVEELAPKEAIEANEEWAAHLEELEGQPTATPDDIVWADVVLLGTPTRFGNVAAQLKQYLDTLGPSGARACWPTRSTPASPPPRPPPAGRSRPCWRCTTWSTTSAGCSCPRATPTR